jgi:hypothetical protein
MTNLTQLPARSAARRSARVPVDNDGVGLTAIADRLLHPAPHVLVAAFEVGR